MANLPPKASTELYTQYTSSRLATCFITEAGIRINFTNYEYYTKNPVVIEYLDSQIAQGQRTIAKGKQVKAEDINPMAAKKRKHIEEFLASQVGRDFSAGKITKEEAAMQASIMTTDDIPA